MTTLPPDTLLTDARDWLRDRLDDGEKCPCCTQFAKVYRRKINSGMAYALLRFYNAVGREWGHKPDVLKGVGAAARDESLLRYWGLFEESTEQRDDGGRSGWWRVTEVGEDFALRRVRVPKYARIYDGRCLGLTGELIDIRDALGDRFSYEELMRRPRLRSVQ